MIPRVIHRIWLGGKAMPAMFAEWGLEWVRLNPGWELREWTETSLPPSDHPGSMILACDLSQRSNIRRYELLDREGGVYVDTDVQPLRPIGDLLAGMDMFVSVMPNRRLCPAVMGCTPGHPCIRALASGITPDLVVRRGALGSAYLQGHNVVALGAQVLKEFMPYEWGDHRAWQGVRLKDADDLRALFPDAVAAHHWSSRWYAPSMSPLRAT